MQNKPLNNSGKEKSLLEILHIVYRRKIIIILFVILSLILAYLYNKFSTPVFESSALLKKENTRGARADDLYELVRLQTMDQIGTEIELIKSNEVLSRVIDELKLRVKLKKVIDPIDSSTYELNNVFIDFPDSGNNYSKQIGFRLPMFKNVKLKNNKTDQELYIVKKSDELFELRDVKEDSLISISNTLQVNQIDTSNNFYRTANLDSITTLYNFPKGSIFKTDFSQFEFYWNDAPVGSKIYFNFTNYYECLEKLSNNIYVSGGANNLFTLSVRSSTPFACKVIAENIINSFRDTRMEQQKQTVRYSFQFVDEQLTGVQKKLLDAESKLSAFKASGQIMTINASTTEIMGYLSTLEAEKLQTDILLTDYKNKFEALKKELQSSQYFDQGFLESSDNSQANSPFAQLMNHLTTLELQKLELLQKRTENHPDVLSLNEQIRLTKEKLADYNNNTLSSLSIMINTLEKKLIRISTLMSRYEDKMQQLPAQENTMASLVREKDVYEKIFKLLLDKREEMRVAELSKLQDIVVIDRPHEPTKPIRPRKLMNMLAAFFIGGFFSIVFIFLLELKNTRFINIDELEEVYKIPVLALIPKYDKNIVKRINNPTDDKDRFVAQKSDNLGIRESYRLLKTKINNLDIRDSRIILVTSCEENTGKTTVAANLAITMAQENKKVLIIDCDLRKAKLTKMFDIPLNSPGLIDFLKSGKSPLVYNKVLKNIDIIPAGGVSENSSLLLNSDRMQSIFEKNNISAYDYVIIDTPPVTRVVDTLVLGQYVKNAILIIRPDTSIKDAVIGGIQDMRQAQIKILGIVVNATDIQNSYRYRYRYGYGYGYGKNNDKSKKNKVFGDTKKSESSKTLA